MSKRPSSFGSASPVCLFTAADPALAGSRSNNRSVVTALGLVSATLREAGEASPSTPCRPSQTLRHEPGLASYAPALR